MRTYVINLDRSPERLAHMRKLLGAMDISFERLPAADGNALPAETLALAPSDLTPGEIGCALSHRAAWERLVASGDSHAAVFEDDIHAASALGRLLADEGWIPPDADVVKLESTRDTVLIDREAAATVDGMRLARLRSTHPGSAGYVLSRAAAVRLLKQTEHLRRPVDASLFELPDGDARHLVVYQLEPAVCIQDAFLERPVAPALNSTLQQERKAVRRKTQGVMHRIRRELTSPFIKLRKRLFYGFGLGTGDVEWRTVPVAQLDLPESPQKGAVAR